MCLWWGCKEEPKEGSALWKMMVRGQLRFRTDPGEEEGLASGLENAEKPEGEVVAGICSGENGR